MITLKKAIKQIEDLIEEHSMVLEDIEKVEPDKEDEDYVVNWKERLEALKKAKRALTNEMANKRNTNN
jgi:hypothetical protein